MKHPAENYIPHIDQKRFREQALRVWAVTAGIVFAWDLLIVIPPLLAGAGHPGFASPLYAFFGNICHQLPDRTFHIGDLPLAVCSRCFGVYAGLLAGVLIYPLIRRVENIEPLPRKWLILSVVPMAIDWSLTVFGIWENTFATRLITGLVLGFACGTYIMPALVEIARNLASPGRTATDAANNR